MRSKKSNPGLLQKKRCGSVEASGGEVVMDVGGNRGVTGRRRERGDSLHRVLGERGGGFERSFSVPGKERMPELQGRRQGRKMCFVKTWEMWTRFYRSVTGRGKRLGG